MSAYLPLFESKFANEDKIDISIQEDGSLFALSVYNTRGCMLYYQVYQCTDEYCGDCSFRPIPNELNDGCLFTTDELKQLFEIDCCKVDDFHLEQLFGM